MGKSGTSTSDFKYFVSVAKKYIKLFGLTEYEIDFEHKSLEDESSPLRDSVAGIKMSYSNKWCTILLNKSWGTTILNKSALEAAAFHEVMHLLLCEYSCFAHARFDVSSQLLSSAEHAVIARLTNIILGEVK